MFIFVRTNARKLIFMISMDNLFFFFLFSGLNLAHEAQQTLVFRSWTWYVIVTSAFLIRTIIDKTTMCARYVQPTMTTTLTMCRLRRVTWERPLPHSTCVGEKTYIISMKIREQGYVAGHRTNDIKFSQRFYCKTLFVATLQHAILSADETPERHKTNETSNEAYVVFRLCHENRGTWYLHRCSQQQS